RGTTRALAQPPADAQAEGQLLLHAERAALTDRSGLPTTLRVRARALRQPAPQLGEKCAGEKCAAKGISRRGRAGGGAARRPELGPRGVSYCPTWPAEKTGPTFWPQIQLLHGYVGIPGPRPFSSPSPPRGRMSAALQPLPPLARLVERPNHFARVIWKSRHKFSGSESRNESTANGTAGRRALSGLCTRASASRRPF